MFGDQPLLCGQRKSRKSPHVGPLRGRSDERRGDFDPRRPATARRAGFTCQVFCSSHMDGMKEVAIEDVLDQYGARYQLRNATINGYQGRLLFTSHRDVP